MSPRRYRPLSIYFPQIEPLLRGCSTIFATRGGKSVRDTVPPQRSLALRPPLAAQKKKEKGEEKSAERRRSTRWKKTTRRGERIPGRELLHATFRLYCDLCARWGWLRATIYGFWDERGDPTSAAGWPAIVFNEITKDPRVHTKQPPSQSFSNASLPASRRMRSMDEGLLWTKVISDVTLYIYIYIYGEEFWKVGGRA